MSVSRDDVIRIATLASLDVAPEAAPALAEQMSRILDYVSQLDAVRDPIDGYRPQSNAEAQPLRDDVVRPPTPPLNPKAFAPDVRDGLFIVPRVGGFGEDDAS